MTSGNNFRLQMASHVSRIYLAIGLVANRSSRMAITHLNALAELVPLFWKFPPSRVHLKVAHPL